MPATTLSELADVLANEPDRSDYDDDLEHADAEIRYAQQHGLPLSHGAIDWTNLPLFGGPEPASTVGVWSWDETHILVGAGADDLRIVSRD